MSFISHVIRTEIAQSRTMKELLEVPVTNLSFEMAVFVYRHFNRFMEKCDNKDRLFEVIEEALSDNQHISTRDVYFAKGTRCRGRAISNSRVKNGPLRSRHKHCLFSQACCNKRSKRATYNLRCPPKCWRHRHPNYSAFSSGFSCTLEEFMEVYIDNGTGKSGRLLDMNACSLQPFARTKQKSGWISCIHRE